MTPAQRLGTVLRVEPDCPQLAGARPHQRHVELELRRRVVPRCGRDREGRRWRVPLSPTYVVHADRDRAAPHRERGGPRGLGDRFDVIPASEHLRVLWLNKGEWPVSARAHLDHEGGSRSLRTSVPGSVSWASSSTCTWTTATSAWCCCALTATTCSRRRSPTSSRSPAASSAWRSTGGRPAARAGGRRAEERRRLSEGAPRRPLAAGREPRPAHRAHEARPGAW